MIRNLLASLTPVATFIEKVYRIMTGLHTNVEKFNFNVYFKIGPLDQKTYVCVENICQNVVSDLWVINNKQIGIPSTMAYNEREVHKGILAQKEIAVAEVSLNKSAVTKQWMENTKYYLPIKLRFVYSGKKITLPFN